MAVWAFRPRADEVAGTAPWLPPGVSEEAVNLEIARLLGPDWQRLQNRIGHPKAAVMLLAGRIVAARRCLRMAIVEVWAVRLMLAATVVLVASNSSYRWSDVAWIAGTVVLVAGYWVTWLRECQARTHLAAVTNSQADLEARRAVSASSNND